MKTGTLYLIPNTLGSHAEQTYLSVLPHNVQEQAAQLTYYIAENAKSARAFLQGLNAVAKLPHPIQHIDIRELNNQTPSAQIQALLEPLQAGKDAGLLSEAGCPAVADPGASVVRQAHALGIKVVPLVGPSSILLALMASGLDGQRFAFQGYIPIAENERATRLRALEQQSRREKQTQIFIETPYRNQSMLQTICNTCTPSTLLCIAVDLTLPSERIMTRSIAAWKKEVLSGVVENALDLHKRPAIFLFLAQ